MVQSWLNEKNSLVSLTWFQTWHTKTRNQSKWSWWSAEQVWIPHLTLPRKDLGADTWFSIDFTAAPEDATAPNLVPHADYQLDNVRPKRVILDRLENKISQSWSKAIKINSSVPSVTGMVIESSSFMWHDTGTGLASTCLITKAGRCTSPWMDDLSDKSRYVTPYDASTSVNQAVAHVVDQIQVLHMKHKLYQKKEIWICYSLIHMTGLYLVTIAQWRSWQWK